MTETQNKSAVWTPSWYEMDQSLTVGLKSKFWFFQDNPSQEDGEEVDFVFFNQLDSAANSELRFACITGIHHEVLGPLSRIDTDGLDYIFTTIAGEDIIVNAEEEPGKTYEGEHECDDWTVLVELTEVSEPISDVV